MQKKYYLAACCILKDEDPFIMEWLTYHSLIGVEYFYIYDNESANPLIDNPIIQKFAGQGKLQVLRTPGKTMQIPAYAHCLQNFGHSAKWLAFIDLDEFICPLEGSDIRPLLAGYEDYAALGLSWKCFNSGGHLSSPKGLIIKNYLERFPRESAINLHIKSIVQPEKVSGVHTPHSFWPKDGEAASSAGRRPITSGTAMTPICWEKAVVNHYILKSQEDAQRRMLRGRADIESDRPTVDNDDFRRMANEPVEPDGNITRFADEVERWMETLELPEEHAAALAEHEPEELLDLAERLMRQGLLKEAGIALCHASLTQSENARLWQDRTRLAGLEGKEDLARLFAGKAARVKSGLPVSIYPKPGPAKKFSAEEAKKITEEVKALMEAGDNKKAEDMLSGLAEEFRLTVEMWLLLGNLAQQKKNLAKAEECVTTALGMEEKLESYLALMRIRLDQKKYSDARDLAFYLIHTGTYRVETPGFYEPLERLHADLSKLVKE